MFLNRVLPPGNGACRPSRVYRLTPNSQIGFSRIASPALACGWSSRAQVWA